MITYPDGYQNRRISFDELVAKHGPKMHPTFRLLFFWYIWSKQGLIGVGGGWRSTQPDRPGFAPDGKSFHQFQTFASGTVGYAAVDMVAGVDGGNHRSPTWAECADAPRYGLHTFITGEPWHIQPVNIRGWGSWNQAGRPDPAQYPGMPQTIEEIKGVPDQFGYNPPDNWGLYPLDPNKPVLSDGSTGEHVRYFQDTIWFKGGGNIDRDGRFGPASLGRANDLRAMFGLPATTTVDTETWGLVDGLIVGFPPPAPTGNGLYWVRPGDSPWAAAERIYGNGAEWPRVVAHAAGGPGFTEADHLLEIPDIDGVQGEVGVGEGVFALIRRLTGESPYHRLDDFYDLNGSPDVRVLHPGDRVFVRA